MSSVTLIDQHGSWWSINVTLDIEQAKTSTYEYKNILPIVIVL